MGSLLLVGVGSKGTSVSAPPGPGTIVTGLIGSWDASVTASLTLSGADILSVADQSGGGNTMTWAVAKPTYSATGFNSTKPAMLFTGGSALKKTSFPMGTGNTLTAWVVCTMCNGTGSGSDARILNYLAPGVTTDWNDVGTWSITRNGLSAMTILRNAGANTGYITEYPAPHRLIFTITSGGFATLYVDGVSMATLTSGGNWTTAGTCQIGQRTDSVAFWAGPVAEAGVATGYSDATTVAALDLYLKTKWGL